MVLHGPKIMCRVCADKASAGSWVRRGVGVLLVAGLALVALFEAPRLFDPGSEQSGGGGSVDDPLLDAQRQALMHPQNPAPWRTLGALQSDAGATASAMQSYRRALTLAPNHGPTQAAMGLLAFEAGEERTAEQHLEQALLLGSGDDGLRWTLDQIRSRRRADNEEESAALRRVRVARAEAVATRTETLALRAETRRQKAETALAKAASKVAATMARAEAHAGGGCWIDLTEPRPGSLHLSVRINGREADLVLDTGANHTVLTTDAADELGLEWRSAPRGKASTVGGLTEYARVPLEDVEIADVHRSAPRAGVCFDCMHTGGDGLLGMDLQRAFGMDLDLAGRRVRIPECVEQ
jgi:clan AA aspartic protease (TIGR02281 family)